MYNPLKILLLVLTVGAFAVAFGAWLRRRFGRSGRTRVRPIANADETLINRVRGTVQTSAPLVSPLTRRECVYYRIEFCDRDVATYEHTDVCDFKVSDGTGVAQVLVAGARIEVIQDIIEFGRASDLSPHARRVLGQLGIVVPDVGSIELCEAMIPLGSTIDIIGNVVREPAPEPSQTERGFREAQPTVLVFSGNVAIEDRRKERKYLGNEPAYRAVIGRSGTN